jgi:hypothetical protein
MLTKTPKQKEEKEKEMKKKLRPKKLYNIRRKIAYVSLYIPLA